MRAQTNNKSRPNRQGGLTIDEFLLMLSGVRKHGDSWLACCPAHDDKTPSMRVKEGERGIMVTCWAGCTFQEITSALGISPSMMFYDALDDEQIAQRTKDSLKSELKRLENILFFGEQAMIQGTITDHDRTIYRDAIARKIQIKTELSEF